MKQIDNTPYLQLCINKPFRRLNIQLKSNFSHCRLVDAFQFNDIFTFKRVINIALLALLIT